MTKNYWFMRLGKKEENEYEYAILRYEAMTIGYGIDQDLSKERTKDQIEKVLKADSRWYYEEPRLSATEQVHNFVNKVSQDDIFILQLRYPDLQRKEYEYWIVKVAGDYQMIEEISKAEQLPNPKRPARKIVKLVEKLKEGNFKGTLEDIVDAQAEEYKKKTLVKLEKSGKDKGLVDIVSKMLETKHNIY